METETDSLEFIFSKISYIHSSHLCSHPYVPLSFPIVEPRAFWSTEMTAIPKSTLGKGKRTQLLQDFLPLLLLVGILNPFRFWASSLWIFTNFLYFSLRSWRFFWCEFDFWPWFFIYTAAQGQKRKRWGEMARESFSHYPPPSASPPPPPLQSFSGSTWVLAFAQLYLLLYEPQKKKHTHQKTTRVDVRKVRLDKSPLSYDNAIDFLITYPLDSDLCGG